MTKEENKDIIVQNLIDVEIERLQTEINRNRGSLDSEEQGLPSKRRSLAQSEQWIGDYKNNIVLLKERIELLKSG